MGTAPFSYWKRGIFRRGKESKGLEGSVPRYATPADQKIDTAMAKKNHFRMQTAYWLIVSIYHQDTELLQI